jgi:hypothetical protein
LARELVADGVAPAMLPDWVDRISNNHQLKPWRRHLWQSPKVPHDAVFSV